MINIKFNSEKMSWLSIFLLALAAIVAYKLLDNLDFIFALIGSILKILTPFIIAFIIAYVLNSPCKKLESFIKNTKWKFLRKRSRFLSVFGVYLFLAGILSLALSFLIPEISKNVTDLILKFPEYWTTAVNWLDYWFDINEILANINIQETITNLDINQYAKGILGFTTSIFTGILAIVASIYMLLDKEHLLATLRRMVSAASKKDVSERIFRYASRVNEIFSKYIYAQLLDSFIIGTLSTVLLTLMGVQYSVFLGFIIGVSNMIPIFGSIATGALTAVITMITGGWQLGLWVAVALLILQQIDGNIIGPRLVGGTLNIRPIGVLIAITIGGGLFGVLGMLFAVPIFAIIKAIITEYMENLEEAKVQENITL